MKWFGFKCLIKSWPSAKFVLLLPCCETSRCCLHALRIGTLRNIEPSLVFLHLDKRQVNLLESREMTVYASGSWPLCTLSACWVSALGCGSAAGGVQVLSQLERAVVIQEDVAGPCSEPFGTRSCTEPHRAVCSLCMEKLS